MNMQTSTMHNRSLPLHEQQCQPQKGAPMPLPDAQALLAHIPGWALEPAGTAEPTHLKRTFQFHDFAATMAFANQVARMADEQDHHPDLHIGYGRCTVIWNTHSVGGLSISDFICAARTARFSPT